MIDHDSGLICTNELFVSPAFCFVTNVLASGLGLALSN